MADLTADLVIVGGGVAGLAAALRAPDGTRIIVIDKGESAAGSSPLAQGGMAAAIGPGDSPALHASDTIAAGAGLCDEAVVADICAQGPAITDWLCSLGVAFDRGSGGELDVAREGAQSVARSVHWIDATGAELVRALRAAVRSKAAERLVARCERLVIQEGRCVGVVAAGRVITGRLVLLATGGAGGLWGATTNQPGATADGAALAMLAGAQLADLEFMQFHPTALAVGGMSQRVLLTEALRGEGAILIDRAGERFVDELGPRSVVARAILDRGGALLDCRKVPGLAERFPTVVAEVAARGFDLTREPAPVEPAAHYFIGGVATDAEGRTSIEGLAAAGEAASTGFHGANRMAGNSLLEAMLIGGRVGARVMDHAEPVVIGTTQGRALTAPPPGLPKILASAAGPIRDEDGLVAGLRALDELAPAEQEGPAPHAVLAGMILRAARARTETRGVHARSDFTAADPALAVRTFDRLPVTA